VFGNIGVLELIILLVPGCLSVLFPVIVIVLLWKIWSGQKQARGFTVSDWKIEGNHVTFYSREGGLVAELRPAGPPTVLLH